MKGLSSRLQGMAAKEVAVRAPFPAKSPVIPNKEVFTVYGLKMSQRDAILGLLALGCSHRRIAREVDRETVSRYAKLQRSAANPAISTHGFRLRLSRQSQINVEVFLYIWLWYWCAWQESNLRPADSKSDALSY